MDIPETMHAMLMELPRKPLVPVILPIPSPSAEHVLIKVIACGVCRTDLHITNGELPNPKLPLIPGHEIVGQVVKAGSAVTHLKVGDMVGIPWLGFSCGQCIYCRRNQENLCENARFTGYTIDGGYAEYTLAHNQYCFPLAAVYANSFGAPLLCAGLIGYRTYSMINKESEKIGIYGFGAAAHILIQVANYQGKKVYAFTRKGDFQTQEFALKMGAVWAGDSNQPAPEKLDAALIFAPAGELIPKALVDTDKGGIVVCGGIHMSDIPSFPYHILWEERSIKSVANLTRKDGEEFLHLAPLIPVRTETQLYPLHLANDALNNLRSGKVQGAAVLVM